MAVPPSVGPSAPLDTAPTQRLQSAPPPPDLKGKRPLSGSPSKSPSTLPVDPASAEAPEMTNVTFKGIPILISKASWEAVLESFPGIDAPSQVVATANNNDQIPQINSSDPLVNSSSSAPPPGFENTKRQIAAAKKKASTSNSFCVKL
ncbi:uncharacterized protein A4U43_C01F32150 [Asparagus officinalis]|uniref:Uncharacterized protein n=1 Tax=Asparagus officinalis TaxID=4686 RepID=A0A5P1FTS9_ASPOF|nr:uncharacterized protein A4U43_C01F32150 [Asparagus officinalis]